MDLFLSVTNDLRLTI